MSDVLLSRGAGSVSSGVDGDLVRLGGGDSPVVRGDCSCGVGGLSVVERWVLSRVLGGGVWWFEGGACPVAVVRGEWVWLPAGVFGGLVERGLVAWAGEGLGPSGAYGSFYRISVLGGDVLLSTRGSCAASGGVRGFDLAFFGVESTGGLLPGVRLGVADVQAILEVLHGNMKSVLFPMAGFGVDEALLWGSFVEPSVLVGFSRLSPVALSGSVEFVRSGNGVLLVVRSSAVESFVLDGGPAWLVDVLHAGAGGCGALGGELVGVLGG